jgi:peptidoglycan hydrolase-like protein with peptidoglycan-binding domain
MGMRVRGRSGLDSAPHRHLRWSAPTGILIVLLAVGGSIYLLTRPHSMGNILGSRSASAATPTAAATPATPAAPTKLLALPKRTIVNGTDAITVTLSGVPASDSPVPTFSPKVAGTWAVVGDSEVFTAASTLQPCSSYTLTVWGHTHATGAGYLGRKQTIGLNVACPSVSGLQQALARLGYLPAKFHPRYIVHIPVGALSRKEAAVLAYHPPRGALVPDPSNAPPVKGGEIDAITRGALEIYQADHGLEASGEPNRETWNSLISAVAINHRDPNPYTWVSVTESLPETLEVHRGHRVVFSTPANTGVPGAETEQGIFPIYARYISTTMSGTDVDGTKYNVPDVPWVNYFNGGDAVHGYPRASYGFPQSNGCVELPIEAAHTVFGMLAIGDIVEVG